MVATYNVAPYIDAFFESLTTQQGGLAGVEVIVVDDGATDGSGTMADCWAQRYPGAIRVIHQTNAGVCAARNAGLAQATGDWIAFPDPDDILSRDYLRHMRAELQRFHDAPLLAVASHMVFYFEQTGEYANHVLRHRFAHGLRRVSSTDPGGMYLAHTTSTLMCRADIMAHGIRFDPAVRPSFEDADFALRLMLAAPMRTISFLPAPVYFYRKRAAADSKIDRITTDPDWYGPHVRTAYLRLLQDAQAARGEVPGFIQQAIILSLLPKLRHLTTTRAALALPDRAAAVNCHTALAATAALLDADILEGTFVPSLQPDERLLLLWYKGLCADVPWVDLVACATASDGTLAICVQWFGVGGDETPVAHLVRRQGKASHRVALDPDPRFVTLQGLQECWLCAEADDMLEFRRGDRPLRLRAQGRDLPRGRAARHLLDLLSQGTAPGWDGKRINLERTHDDA